MKDLYMKNFTLLILIIFLSSCEEVIEVDLDSSEPVLVAEGLIEKDSAAWLKLSFTKDYFSSDKTTTVKNATVSISDGQGNSENLEHIDNGFYKGQTIKGEPDLKYTLTFSWDGIERSASSKLHSSVPVYSVEVVENEMPRLDEEDTYRIILKIGNNRNKNEYHLVKFWVNGMEDKEGYYHVKTQYYSNVDTIKYMPMQLVLEKGDKLKTRVYSIDENAYNYYNGLNDIISNGMMQQSTLYNPKSNFGDDVLGYFTAWSFAEYNTSVD